MGNTTSQFDKDGSFISARSFLQQYSSKDLQRYGSQTRNAAAEDISSQSYELSTSVSKSRLEQKNFEFLLSDRFAEIAASLEPSALSTRSGTSTWPVLLAIARWLHFDVPLANSIARPECQETDLLLVTQQSSTLSSYQPVDVMELLSHPNYEQWWKSAALSLGLKGKPTQEVYEEILNKLLRTDSSAKVGDDICNSTPTFCDIAPYIIPYLHPSQLPTFCLVNKSFRAEVKSIRSDVTLHKITAQLPRSFPNVKRVVYAAEEPMDTKHFAVLGQLHGLHTLHAVNAEISDFLTLRQLSTLTELQVELPFFDVYSNTEAVVHEIFFQGVFWALPQMKVLRLSMSQGSFNEHTFDHMASFMRPDVCLHLIVHRHQHCSATHLNAQPLGRAMNTAYLAAQLQLISGNVLSVVCTGSVEYDPILAVIITAALSLFDRMEEFQVPPHLVHSLFRKGDLDAALLTSLITQHNNLRRLGLGNPRMSPVDHCLPLMLPPLHRLTHLDLSAWSYTSPAEANETWQALSGCTNLERVKLDAVLQEAGTVVGVTMRDVASVWGDGDHTITGTGLFAALSALPRLTHLHLSRVEVDRGLSQISWLRALECLVLEDTYFFAGRAQGTTANTPRGVLMQAGPAPEQGPGSGSGSGSTPATPSQSSRRLATGSQQESPRETLGRLSSGSLTKGGSLRSEASFASAVSHLPSTLSMGDGSWQVSAVAEGAAEVLMGLKELQQLTSLKFGLSQSKARELHAWCASGVDVTGWLWPYVASGAFRESVGSLPKLMQLEVWYAAPGDLLRDTFLDVDFTASLLPVLLKIPELKIRRL